MGREEEPEQALRACGVRRLIAICQEGQWVTFPISLNPAVDLLMLAPHLFPSSASDALNCSMISVSRWRDPVSANAP